MGRALVLGVVVTGLMIALVASQASSDDPPRLAFREGTPGDVMALGDSTFADILETFPGQIHCLDDVTVAHNWDLGPEAGFYQGNYIEIEVPNTAIRIRRTYLHEFGHHLDVSCSDAEVRAQFSEAMGHSSGTDWLSESRPWHMRPSEQFAEAVVALVGGSPLHSDITLTSEAVVVVSTWAGP